MTRPLGIKSLLAATLCTLALAPTVNAQTYPDRPVKIIVATGPGGGADALGRMVAQQLTELWGKSVYVENMAGAGGIIGTQAMIKATADGYTLGVLGTNHVINPLFSKLPYDQNKELKGIISITNSAILIVSNPSFPVKSIAELIALAKSKPTVINYGSSGKGGLLHLVMELFDQQAGTKMTHVPYSSLPKMMSDLVGGQIPLASLAGASAIPLMKGGKLNGLVVAATQRSRFMPDVPASPEVGLPGFVVNSWLGLAAPVQLPDAIVARLFTDISTITRRKDFETQMLQNGFETVLLNGEQTMKRLADETATWRKLVVDAQIKPD